MRKRIVSSFMAISMVAVMTGCGSKDSVSTKVELRDDPVKSSSDYAGGNGNVVSTIVDNKDEAGSADTSGGNEVIKVGFIQTANESGWRAAHTASMADAFSDSSKYEYRFVDGEGDQKVQIAGIEKLITDGYDVIILDPIVEKGWEDALKKAKDAGIPVIVVDRMVSADDSLYACWLGSDFDKEGQDAANWLVDNVEKGKHKAVVLEGTSGASAQIGRSSGVEKVFAKNDDFSVIASECGEFNKADGKKVMEKFLKEQKGFDIIISQNDDMTFGAVEAIEEAGQKASDYTIVSFDGQAEAFKYMIDGKISVVVECNPLQGPTVAGLVDKVLAGESVDKVQYMEEGVFPAATAKDEIGNRQF